MPGVLEEFFNGLPAEQRSQALAQLAADYFRFTFTNPLRKSAAEQPAPAQETNSEAPPLAGSADVRV